MEDLLKSFQEVYFHVEPFDPLREYNYLFYAISINKYLNFYEDSVKVLMYLVAITVIHIICTQILTFIGNRSLPVGKSGKIHPSKLNKFTTAGWKGVSYVLLICISIFCLYGESWVFDTKSYWKDWPIQITFWVQQQYFIQIAYYIHASIVIFWQPKLKDRNEMLIHHVATISLLTLSYCWGYYRVGAVIMLLHDVSDPLMEFAKLSIYTKRENAGNIFFACFTFSFIFTRCVIYPTYILSSVWVEARRECPYCCGWWTFNIFLFTLQFLHLFWSVLILKILITALQQSNVQGDVRESDDEDD